MHLNVVHRVACGFFIVTGSLLQSHRVGLAEECVFFAKPTITTQAPDRFKLTAHMPLPASIKLNTRRGSLVVRLIPNKPFGGHPTLFEITPGPPHLTVRISGKWVDEKKPGNNLTINFRIGLVYQKSGNEAESVQGNVNTVVGQELHAVWTWSGVEHCLYINGARIAHFVANSVFPDHFGPASYLLCNTGVELLEAAPVNEIAGYDFAMSSEQVRVDFDGNDDQPLVATKPQVPSIVARWAPGELKSHVAVDTGEMFVGNVVAAELVFERDGKPFHTHRLPVNNGFAQDVVSLVEMPAGRYSVTAQFVKSNGVTIATSRSDEWDSPKTEWLRNNIGLSEKVQPPWTPIEQAGLALKTWGRIYDFSGGFGLPTSITSQSQPLLSKPIQLEFLRDGKSLPLEKPEIEITSIESQEAKWIGSAVAGDVMVNVRGRLEYDGMALITLRLEPRQPGTTARLDSVQLRTTMPDERAKFLNTSTDQGGDSYKDWVPRKPGLVLDNLKLKPARTSFLYFIVFSDEDRGLEWFTDQLSGWQIDENKPVQQIFREDNGNVRLQCDFVNKPFELHEPIEITFGYMATPVKPLPTDWRTAYVNHQKLQDIKSDLAIWWLWTDARFSPFRSNIFSLRPDDLKGFAQKKKIFEVKLIPFTNQHVTIPAYPDNKRESVGWPWFNNLLQDESANDGWVAVPTRGIRDYWAWNLNQWIAAHGIDGIYMDEANIYTVSSNLLTGSAYLRSDGTTAYGHNTLAMREQFKRVRQVMLDNGIRPIIWIPTYGSIIPHAFSFVDIVSEGESNVYHKAESPDWIDTWGSNLLTHVPKSGGGWLRALGPAQKYGFIPIFLDEVKLRDSPGYMRHIRAMVGLLAIHDIIPMNVSLGWLFKAKQDFGVADPSTQFHRYHEQTAIRAPREDVLVSYYQRNQRVLAIVLNIGKESFSDNLTLNLSEMGLDTTIAASSLSASTPPNFDVKRKEWKGMNVTAVARKPMVMSLSHQSVSVKIPPHDFIIFEIGPSSPEPRK